MDFEFTPRWLSKPLRMTQTQEARGSLPAEALATPPPQRLDTKARGWDVGAGGSQSARGTEA